MKRSDKALTRLVPGAPGVALLVAALALPAAVEAQTFASRTSAVEASEPTFDPSEVTFTRDIAPILQETCQRCHRSGGVAPMSLVTYDEVRPWAPIIKEKTAIRDRMGAMPPYYLEHGIGIQQMKDDERLTDEEVAKIAAWADNGAPEGDPADMPEPVDWPTGATWQLGEPDLVVRSQDFSMEAGRPDWWGDMESIPIPIEQDRYVNAVEIREVNNAAGSGGGVGGLYIVHHVIWRTETEEDERQSWPVHELGRNPDIFNPRAGRLLEVGSEIVSESVHLNAAAQDAEAYLEFGFHFHPVGYEPEYERTTLGLGDGLNIDIQPNEDGQELHAFVVLDQHTKLTSFEPHLHAPGDRMCLEAIWGNHIETLSCSGYDHNWVKQYTYDDDYAPILPKGTILHIGAEMDNTADNPNIPDPRNWQGSGNRSVSNMFIDLGTRVALTDQQFIEEMRARREAQDAGPNDHIVGCPLCMADLPALEASLEEESEGTAAPAEEASTADQQGAGQ